MVSQESCPLPKPSSSPSAGATAFVLNQTLSEPSVARPTKSRARRRPAAAMVAAVASSGPGAASLLTWC